MRRARLLRCMVGLIVFCCAGAVMAQRNSAGDQTWEFRIATLAPADSTWMRDMLAGAERIRELTDGRVSFKFRAGGIAGSADQVLRRIRGGDYQGGAFTAGELASVYTGLNIYSVPLMFESLDEVNYIRTRMDPKLVEGLEQAGFVSFGFGEGGFSNLMTHKPVRHIDDLRREKIWVPRGDEISYAVLEALRLAPVPLDLSDALLGLRTGLVDAVAASPFAALVLQWHTEIEYVTDLPLSYSMGVFAIANDAFYSLREDDQQIVRTVISSVMTGIDEASREDNDKALAEMLERGIQLVPVNAADVENWRELIEAQYDSLRQRRDIDPALFDEMLALLEEYRSSH